jgi:hypothetical protein
LLQTVRDRLRFSECLTENKALPARDAALMA